MTHCDHIDDQHTAMQRAAYREGVRAGLKRIHWDTNPYRDHHRLLRDAWLTGRAEGFIRVTERENARREPKRAALILGRFPLVTERKNARRELKPSEEKDLSRLSTERNVGSSPPHTAHGGKRRSSLRQQVLRRDHGICAMCTLDTERLRVLLERVSYSRADQKVLRTFWKILRVEGRKSLWDADHIVPLTLGGRDEVENMRTLCVWCHREETERVNNARHAVSHRLQSKSYTQWRLTTQARRERWEADPKPTLLTFMGGPKSGLTITQTEPHPPREVFDFTEERQDATGEWRLIHHYYQLKRVTENGARIYGFTASRLDPAPQKLTLQEGPKSGLTITLTQSYIPPEVFDFTEERQDTTGRWRLIRHYYRLKQETENGALIYGFTFSRAE
jgi:5-methylcytosine-specific restriction endonuclease McrA